MIARLHKALDLPTNTELAAWLGTDKRTVSHWKKRNGVPCKAVIRVSDATGTTLDWLLLGRDASRRAITSGPNEQTLKVKFLVGARVYINGDRSLVTTITGVVWRGEHVEYEVGWLADDCAQSARFPEWRLACVDAVISENP